MKNIFYFTLKALFVLKNLNFFLKIRSKFLYWIFGQVEKQLDKKAKDKFKSYDVINWETNNYNADIAQYLKK